MKKEELLRKLTSRKFIISAITALVGVLTMIIGSNQTVNAIAGAAMVILPTVVYCIMEGRVDAASVGKIKDATVQAADELGASDEAKNAIGFVADAVKTAVEEDGTET